MADNATGGSLHEILRAADRTGTPVERATASRVKWLAGNGKHDQGVVADVNAPRMTPLEEFVRERGKRPTNVFLLDGVTNPGNVGMILRTATGAGFDGVILPRAGTPHVGPLVIKASAGIAFQAPIVNTLDREDGGRRTADGRVPRVRAVGPIAGLAVQDRARAARGLRARRGDQRDHRAAPIPTCRSRCTPASNR